MHAKLGNHVFVAILLAGVAVPTAASAQVNDFATCSIATTTGSTCNASGGVSSCCQFDGAGSSGNTWLRSGSDYALIIPLDRCHQRPGTSKEGDPYDVTGAGPVWCADPAGGGDNGMFHAYGLVYRLMQNDIPVYWIVNPSKDPPALSKDQNAASQTYIRSDVDMWVLSAGATPITTATTPLSSCGAGCTSPVKHVTLAASNITVDATYSKKEFAIRGGAFMIRATDRAAFNKFIKRQAPYTTWANRSGCGGGGACYDFSAVDLYEVQPGAHLGWTDFSTNTNHDSYAPLAVTIEYAAPRIARIGGGAVSEGWLKRANLFDPAASSCTSGAFAPTDAVYCTVSASDIAGNKLISGAFGWAWVDNATTGCSTATDLSMWSAMRTFVTQQAGTRAAGNAMLMDSPVSVVESCNGKQLLGAETAGYGVKAESSSTAEPYILRYPQNLFQQFGDVPVDYSSSSMTHWAYYGAGVGGYNSLFTGSMNSLHRLATVDIASGTNTLCSAHKSTAACDVAGGASGDNLDVAAYGRFQNNANNGIVFYLPGNQISNNSAQLRMVLNSLIATPIATVPVGPTTEFEVSRATPIVATINNTPALVQGSYVVLDPQPVVSTFATVADANNFRFPYVKGHLRAVATSAFSPGTQRTFNSGSPMFDAADLIPTPNYAGCSHFTSTCRTVFSNTSTGRLPDKIYLESANVNALGAIMASNLTATEWSVLIQRVLAGFKTVSGSFIPKLGGVDRSTVAVIPTSNVAGLARPTMIYFGAQDGMLHAVCASIQGPCDALGRELWAYIPRTTLPFLRFNTAQIQGSPRVADAYGDFYGTGKRSWKTILTIQTGSGDATSSTRTPAVIAMDITDPTAPNILWEYTMADANSRGALELGQGLALSMGTVRVGDTTRNLTFAQTNNAGVGGAGSVVTAIDTETGIPLWQTGYVYPAPRSSIIPEVPSTGIPGGAVPVDKTGTGNATDLVYATLYGDMFVVDPATGISRYGGGTGPLFRFSTDYHPIGAMPGIYSNGSQQFAVISSGGYTDLSDTLGVSLWTTPLTQHYAVGISLNTPTAVAPLNEGSASTYIPFKLDFGIGEKGYSQVLVVGGELFVTTETQDVNALTYGAIANTGRVYRLNLSTGASSGTTVVVQGGASSVVNNGNELFVGSSTGETRLGTGATVGGGVGVDSVQAPKLTRTLWLRTM